MDDTNTIRQTILAEILWVLQQRYPRMGEEMLRPDATALTEVIVCGVRAALTTPVRPKKPAALVLPSFDGIDPVRMARLQQSFAAGNERLRQTREDGAAQLRRNCESRAREMFDGTGVSSATVEAFITAAKREAGW